MVAELQEGFGQLEMRRVVVGLVGLRLERGGLREAQVVDGARGIDPVVARQALVEGFQ